MREGIISTRFKYTIAAAIALNSFFFMQSLNLRAGDYFVAFSSMEFEAFPDEEEPEEEEPDEQEESGKSEEPAESIAVVEPFLNYGPEFIGPILPDSSDLIYPIEDQRFQLYNPQPSTNPFDLNPQDFAIEYDPLTGEYTFNDPNVPTYLPPQTMSFDEYWQYQDQQNIDNNWESLSQSNTSDIGTYNILPTLNLPDGDLGNIFGGNQVDIRPSGGIELLLGFRKQKIENPTLPQRLQNQPAQPDFNMTPNLSVQGKIGENLNFNINYSTQTTFDFENQVRLEYTGDEDDIIQKIEAGNVDFQLPVSLIPGSQSLFGLKTKLKFGRLTATSVISQQKSKAERITIKNGAQEKDFEMRPDQFEQNRHFFIAQYFKDNYNKALASMPCISSEVQINYLEVWVSNNTGATQDTRNVMALMDLAEPDPYRQPNILSKTQEVYPSNQANSLYSDIVGNGTNRSQDAVITNMESDLGLNNIEDFRFGQARRLRPNEFTFDPQLGFISLNAPLQTDDIVGVSFEYQTIWGDTYRVGEFADQLPPNANDQGREQVLFVKMLKSIRPEPNLPIWDLMMRNVYKIPQAFRINEEDFRLNVFYQLLGGVGNSSVTGGGVSVFLPEGTSVRDKSIIQLIGLDRLNFQDDPKPDGTFDFFTAKPNSLTIEPEESNPYSDQNLSASGQGISGINNTGSGRRSNNRNSNNRKYYSTIDARTGRVYFPVLQPFGKDLRAQFSPEEENIADKYVYEELYDTTLTIARQFPEKNRFLIKGRYKSGVSSEFSLGAFNIPEGSVTVWAGGKQLTEGVDYTINYSLGKVTVINDAYLNSGIPINIDYEDPALFSIQQKTYFGTRLDYWINDDFTLGGTYVHLSQRPFTQKVNYGDDAISNRMVGLDGNYFKEAPGITRFVDKIPGINTKEKSTVTINAEGAKFIPGHAKAIDLGNGGVIFLDDFEGTQSEISLEFPINKWQLASTPRNGDFANADLVNDLSYNDDRARFAWYKIDNAVYSENNTQTMYTRNINFREVFPQTERQFDVFLRSLDLAYFPNEKGPYNFNTDPMDVNTDGSLKNPKDRWGGMMRDIELNDFQFHNIEFIEFWMLDPFLENPNNPGTMYLNLGTVSEDILKDGRRSFENGLPVVGQPENTDTTAWARVSNNNVIAQFFDSDTSARRQQDIGLDGLNNDGERVLFKQYLDDLVTVTNIDQSSQFYQETQNDPANDDFRYFIGANFDASADVVERYKRFNNPEGNSVTQDAANNQGFTTSSTNLPDNEDLNDDNALEQAEAFFQYKIDLRPNMEIGENFITNIRESEIPNIGTARWLKFQIPIADYEKAVGGIDQFTAIQFMRLYMTDFQDPVVCRMADFNLVRNQWRRYESNILEEGEYQPTDNFGQSDFNVTSVSIQQHYEKFPVPYRLPPGVIQEEIFNNTSTPLTQNEQSLSLQVCNLEDGVANAVFKTERYDMRQFKRLQMWVHAEEGFESDNTMKDGDVSAIIRIGSDFVSNYYEYEVPLSITPEITSVGNSEVDKERIWPYLNRIDLELNDLVDLKKVRNFTLDEININKPYSVFLEDTLISNTGEQIPVKRKLTVVGSPDLGKVATIMLGVRNPKRTSFTEASDDGLAKCAEVWFNELALSGFNEEGGYAAQARMDVKLADFGNVTVSGNLHTTGFGSLEQKVNDRYQDNYRQYDVTANLNLDKFLPKNSGIKIPLYAGYSESISTPQYHPYDTDIILEEALDSVELYKGKVARDSLKKQSQEYTNIKSVNVSNVRKVRTDTKKKQRFYDIENFNVSAAYTETNFRDPYIESEKEQRYTGELGYNFTTRPNYIKPFNKLIKSNSKWLKMIKDINFNLKPSNLSFKTDLNRLYSETKYRNLVGDKFEMPTLYNKDFVWGRYYGLKFDLMKSLSLDYTATNLSRLDEPIGPKNDASKEQVWDSFKDLGRTINYTQTANVNFDVPIDKIPLFDWTKLRARYGTNYEWITGPLMSVDSLDKGNIIMNQANLQLNGELNFSKLYGKSKFLKQIDRPSRGGSKKNKPKPKGKDDPKDGKEEADGKKKKSGNGEVSPIVRAVVSPILMIKRVSLTYNDRRASEVPGFNPKSGILGQDWDGNGSGAAAPGIDFLFGKQPDKQWLDDASNKNWITSNALLNRQFRQTNDKTIQGKASLEPWNGFKIDLTLNKNERETYTELYKVNKLGEFQHMAPNSFGSYSVSYIPFKTSWDQIDDSTMLSQAFEQFEANRTIVSERLGEKNLAATGSYFNPADSSFVDEFSRGYGPYAQDVLIPAFLAAYKGVDARNIELGDKALRQFPLPNWSVSWNGLSRLSWFKNVISNMNLTHRYSSTYTVNSFRTEPNYQTRVYDTDPFNYSPYAIDSLSGNFFTRYRIPDIQITEQFSPLIGLDMTFTNSFNTRVEYGRRRSIGLSLIDYQINEQKGSEFLIGAGYQIAGLKLPFKNKEGEQVVLENDLTFQFDFSITDNITSIYALDQGITQPTNGNITYRLSPTLDYVVNDQIRLTLYYEWSKSVPYTTQSYPRTDTRGGIKVNFSLAQ